jgi:two-component sensor histidine kinase
LMVSDNGVGFPQGLDFRDTGSLGLQLVNTLVEQIEGTIELDRSDGTAFRIAFAELKSRKG